MVPVGNSEEIDMETLYTWKCRICGIETSVNKRDCKVMSRVPCINCEKRSMVPAEILTWVLFMESAARAKWNLLIQPENRKYRGTK